MASEEFERGARAAAEAFWAYLVNEDGVSIVLDPDYNTRAVDAMQEYAYEDAVWAEDQRKAKEEN